MSGHIRQRKSSTTHIRIRRAVGEILPLSFCIASIIASIAAQMADRLHLIA